MDISVFLLAVWGLCHGWSQKPRWLSCRTCVLIFAIEDSWKSPIALIYSVERTINQHCSSNPYGWLPQVTGQHSIKLILSQKEDERLWHYYQEQIQSVSFIWLKCTSQSAVLVSTVDHVAVLSPCSHSVGDAYSSSFLPSSLIFSLFSVTPSINIRDVIYTW